MRHGYMSQKSFNKPRHPSAYLPQLRNRYLLYDKLPIQARLDLLIHLKGVHGYKPCRVDHPQDPREDSLALDVNDSVLGHPFERPWIMCR